MSKPIRPLGYQKDCTCPACSRYRRDAAWHRMIQGVSDREAMEWPGLRDTPSDLDGPAAAMILDAYAEPEEYGYTGYDDE